ncbi:MAG: membrane protein insertion efficiency factor YidD [Rickettsiales bacterium]
MKRLLLSLLYCYRRLISPMKPSCCRFYPTCSTYAVEAVEKHGAVKGGYLMIRRILRCHPLGGHGIDLVPPSTSSHL